MELPRWFDYQLRSTLDGFIWAVLQLPPERRYTTPPAPLGLGEWSAAQHVYHMLEYEEKLALPSMRLWLGAPPVADTRTEQDLPSMEDMLVQFELVRHEEINLLPKFSPQAWNSKQQTTFWGEVSLFWLVCKTYQHTTEHTHDILSLSLFWDRRLERMAHG
jgi:type II secretory pathway component PulL